MTELLLGWNKHLAKQRDHHGRTPLHFAVSSERETYGLLPPYAVPVKQRVSITTVLNIREPPLELAKQLMDAHIYSAYQPDKKGSFPVHIAASAGRLCAIKILITRYPGCAALRDSDGRTFLHVAVNKKRYHVVAYACKTLLLSTILNMQDKDGNTALHLAVEVGDWWIFARLFVNKQVELNLLNNRQETPLELSINTIPTGLYCSLLVI
jgi:ankyrin repeat protein